MKHVLISGTGRTGTTFLVALLTRLGLDTGFTEDDLCINDTVRAGLEGDARQSLMPFIVKSPWICYYVDELLEKKAGDIELVIVPIRDLRAAAESRRSAQRKIANDDVAAIVHGGLWPGVAPDDQEEYLLQMHYRLVFHLAKHGIPIMHLHYPRLVRDPQYLYEKLAAVIINCSRKRFDYVFWQTIHPEWVHSLSDADSWDG